VTGFEPFGDYQIEPATYLANGQSVILRMPTGSGKSESILCAYLWALKQKADFPQQMLYGLPMRNLADSLGQRFSKYQRNFDQISIAVQHGAQPGTPAFLSDVAVTTIDQLISAYACTPLGYPVRHGSIPAGAVASAFLAFDEVHTFDPERALQSALFIAEHSHRMGISFAFLSATMPDSFVEALQQHYQARLIDVEESDIPRRQGRQVNLVNRLAEQLTPGKVEQAWGESKGSLLVVCNTVKEAQALWSEVQKRLAGVEVILLHSRFTADDRAEKEKTLDKLIGQNPTRQGVVITTQVVEVGLDVSARLLLTELAPIDALIQRAGRVARWGGCGEVRMFGIEQAAPYGKHLIEKTQTCLPDGEISLDWRCEQKLVNAVLGSAFAGYLTSENRGKALYWLGEGAFSGSRSKVAKAVRDNRSCTVSICHDPNALGRDVWRLPQIRLNVWTLYSYAKQESAMGIWRVVTDEISHDAIDQEASVGCLPLSTPDWLFPGGFYVLSPEIARYEPEGRGLVLGEIGESMTLQAVQSKKKPAYEPSNRESWVEHCQNVLDVFHNTFVPCYEGILERLAVWWKISPADFIARVGLCAALHDLGKLTVEWQEKIGRQENELPIGHSGDYDTRRKLPPHATVSAYLLQDLFRQWGRRPSEPLLCAIAHHHSVRASQVPRFRLVAEWDKQVEALFSTWPDLCSLWNVALVNRFSHQVAPTELPVVLPDIASADGGRAWRTYAIVSRLIRLSDRMATGGSEDALLRDEDWLTDV
jgi:CRISPR-associated endonuclease/helicase Cas3